MAGDNPDPNATGEGEAEQSGADLSLLLGEIKSLYDLDLEEGYDAEDVLKALVAAKKGGGAEGEGGGEEAVKAAADLRVALGLDETAGYPEMLTAVSAATAKLDVSTGTLKAMSDRLEVLEVSKKTADIEDALKAYPRKINTRDAKQVAGCRKILDLVGAKAFAEYMATQPNILPESGAIPGPGEGIAGVGGNVSREKLIATAARDYPKDHFTAKICSEREFVDQKLRDAGLGTLSDDEATKHEIKAFAA